MKHGKPNRQHGKVRRAWRAITHDVWFGMELTGATMAGGQYVSEVMAEEVTRTRVTGRAGDWPAETKITDDERFYLATHNGCEPPAKSEPEPAAMPEPARDQYSRRMAELDAETESKLAKLHEG